jgi:cellulose synthase/poly-beta-1,6-N-acetylglucosamine synthase-like glycosyltransferase
MVSVVMTVFNGERFLPEAVESILDQGFRDFEFIIIDDGSTDCSASILDSYQHSDARIRVCHEEHAGLIKSLNRGCELARGKYLARMDADDVAVQSRLGWQVDFMEVHQEIGVLGAAVEWIDATGKSLGIYPNPTGDREIKADLHRALCVFWHPTILLRREVFAWSGGYRSGIVGAEDYDLWLRTAERFQMANLEAVLVKYRIHPGQESMRKRKQQTLSKLAAQASASFRSKGLPDPVNSLKEITPEALDALGVREARQQSQLASDCRHWIRLMFMAGEYEAALSIALETLDSNLESCEQWQIADLYLIVAKLYWRQKKFAKGFLAAGRGVFAYPLVVGRPLKSAMRRFGLAGAGATR